MYELMDVLVAKLKFNENNNGRIEIDENVSYRTACAVDKENTKAINLSNNEEYAYLSTCSGMFLMYKYSLNPNELYALRGVKILPKYITKEQNKKFNDLNSPQKTMKIHRTKKSFE